MTSELAIIIANYNGYDDTVRCLESLERSTYRDFFVVVVDDCSDKAESIRLLEMKCSYDLIVLKTDSNQGFAGANNVGIANALSLNPKYIMLLNNDTEVPSDSIGTLMKRASQDKIVGPKILRMDDKSVIYSAGGTVDKNGYIPRNIGAGCKDNGDYDSSKVCDFLSFCCAVIPVSLFERIGLLSTDYYMYSEDVDYCMRSKAAGVMCHYIPECYIYHKDGGSGISKVRIGTYYGIRNECYIRQRYFENGKAVNDKLFAKVKREYVLRKFLRRPHPDNEIYYLAMKAYMDGETGKSTR